jgi:hypothetical protein
MGENLSSYIGNINTMLDAHTETRREAGLHYRDPLPFGRNDCFRHNS